MSDYQALKDIATAIHMQNAVEIWKLKNPIYKLTQDGAKDAIKDYKKLVEYYKVKQF